MSAASPDQVMAQMYDASAAAYARHWAPVLHRHTRDLVAMVPFPPAATVVDVAAGTGALLPTLSQAVGPAGAVLALDRSRGMLLQAGTDHPRAQSDASRLPLADASVDVVVWAFVLFLLPDAGAAAAEAARVLRPGGTAAAATWSSQSGTAADTLIRGLLDEVGAPPFPDVPRSDRLTDSPEAMTRLLEGAGFHDVRTRTRPLAAQFDAEAVLELRLQGGVLRWRLDRLEPEVRSELVRRARDEVAQMSAGDLRDDSEVLLSVARL